MWKQRKVRCPDGSFRYVFKNADDAFPLQLQSSDNQLKTSVDALESVTAEIDAKVSKSISGLLFAINNKNDSLMMSFRALYNMYQTDPCSNSDRYADGVERLVREQASLADVTVRLQGLIALIQSNGGQSETILIQLITIVQQLGSTSPEVASSLASLAIAGNRDAAEKWIREDHELSSGEPSGEVYEIEPLGREEE